MQKRLALSGLVFAFATVTLTLPTAAHAGGYPINTCVSAKMKAASAKCKALLGAWAAYDKGGGTDTTKRDDTITKASGKFSAAWGKAETKSSGQGVDCSQPTLSEADMETLIDNDVTTIVTDVNTGLNLSVKANASCGAALLKAAAAKCAAFLKAEGGYVAKLAAGHAKRDAAETKASNKFMAAANAALMSCPTNATATSLETAVDGLSADVVTNSTISQALDNTQFTVITPSPNPATDPAIPYQGDLLSPICSDGSPYHFFVKRGSVNKLVMYYQGGGACWDQITCGVAKTFDQTVIPNGTCHGGTNNNQLCDTLADCPDQSGGTSCNPGFDNPNQTMTGFGDLTNPDNPFKDWNIVFVAYCTGDIHFGDNHKNYGGGTNIWHFGWHNARVAEKFAREHFVNPDEVFVTGSSAGAYGAFFNAPLHEAVWPDSKFSVLADAGNGVITTEFLTTDFPVWNFTAHLPSYIPGVLESITQGTGIPGFTQAVTSFFPNTAWAHYATAYDGSTGGQTGFYNVMVHLHDPVNPTWLTWWTETCAWNNLMVAQAAATYTTVHATPADNYRYYIGRGSRHTGYGSDPVVYQQDTLNASLPTLKDWVNSMRARDAGWVNETCTDCATLRPGDPQPNPLAEPFEASGPDVIVNCP